MNLSPRPVRVIAAVGAVVAAGTTTFLALSAGTASADEPGRCTQNVNVREDADANSKIVAMCDAGTAVKLGEERDGFVHLEELGGWASKDFVKADEQAADAGSSDDNGSDAASSDDARSDDAPGDASSGDASSADADGHGSGHDADGAQGSADGDHRSSDGADQGAGSTGGDQSQQAARPAHRTNAHGVLGLLG